MKRKISMGIPLYARSYVGRGNAPGDERPQPYSGYEICEYDKLPWSDNIECFDETAKAAYIQIDRGSNRHEFISYDSPDSVRFKGEYVRDNGLAGLFYVYGSNDCFGNLRWRSLILAGYKALHPERPAGHVAGQETQQAQSVQVVQPQL